MATVVSFLTCASAFAVGPSKSRPKQKRSATTRSAARSKPATTRPQATKVTAPPATPSVKQTPATVVPTQAPLAATFLYPKNAFPAALRNVKLTGERPNPCVALHWIYNPARQGFDALPAVTEAVRTISEVTGIEFVYDGLTGEYDVGVDSYDPSTVDIEHPRTSMVVQWEDPARPVTSDAEDSDSVVLGVASAGYRRERAGAPAEFADGASLTFRVDPLLNRPATFRKTALHELGHVMGLDHVSDPTSLMYPYAEGEPKLNAYDRIAFAAVGRPGSEGCQ